MKLMKLTIVPNAMLVLELMTVIISVHLLHTTHDFHTQPPWLFAVFNCRWENLERCSFCARCRPSFR